VVDIFSRKEIPKKSKIRILAKEFMVILLLFKKFQVSTLRGGEITRQMNLQIWNPRWKKKTLRIGRTPAITLTCKHNEINTFQ
jgi:hypothetical protein